MKITLELNDTDTQTLARWASVSRTLNFSKQLLQNCLDHYQEDESKSDMESKAENLNLNLDELEKIGPVLDSIHQQIRSQVWEEEQKERTRVSKLPRRVDSL